MYNKVIRDEAYKAQLIKFIEMNYPISIGNLVEAKRGYFGETWKADTEEESYFIKIDYCDAHKQIYIDSFAVIDYLCKNGITHISKILKTKSNELYTSFNDGVIGVFIFVEGKNTEEYPISKLFKKLAPVYKVPVENLGIKKEDYDISYVDEYYSNLEKLKLYAADPNIQELVCFLEEKSSLIELRACRLKLFANRCKDDYNNFHITHGDAGGNSILKDDDFTIIDWDQPMLAPIERDAWFFICKDENMKTINQILRSNKIEYKLQNDRLAFYCYFSFFYYLHEHLSCLFDFNEDVIGKEIASNIKEYFVSWISNQLNRADKFY
jgi:hypothetical protein